MVDYKEEMAAIFTRYYAPDGEMHAKKNMTTTQIDFLFRGIIPNLPTSEHDVYELMKELGFQQEKVIVEADKKEGIQEEIDLIPVGEVFKWIVFEKD